MKKTDGRKLHTQFSGIVKEQLKKAGYDVKTSDDRSFDIYVGDAKCKINTHKNINGSVVIEYATDKHNMLDAGYDKIVYMDVADGAKNEIYIAPVQTVAKAIQNRLGRSQHYFQCSRKDVLENTGLCVGISVAAFKNIEGVETITF